MVQPLIPLTSFRTRAGRTLDFSHLGFGAAPIGNMHSALSDEDAAATVEAAWRQGVRYFDTAPLYGHGLSEMRLGAALSMRPRGSFLLSTKVGRVLEPCAPGAEDSGIYVGTPAVRVRWDYSRDGILRSVDDSLRRLGLDRIDILYIHDIEATAHGSEEGADARFRELLDRGGWDALDMLRSTGTVTAVGAGVNSCAPCERLLQDADPDLFLLAGRYTLLDQSGLRSLLPACHARGVGVLLGGPFNSGILVTGPHRGATYDYAPASEAVLAKARALADIAARHGVALADAALQFPLAHPAVAAVIAGARTPAEVDQAAAGTARTLPGAFWAEIASSGLLADGTPLPVPLPC